jgi:23S rRNA pseudouridine1911/1915/1917 synthase
MADQRFFVEAMHAGQRLDKFVVLVVPGLGRKGARRLFEDGRVRLNGRRPNKGDVTREGDHVTIALPDAVGPQAVPQADAPLTVRLETPLVVVVEKPAGQPTAPLRDGETGTLANALVGRYPEMAIVGHSPREPGLVHRLDTDTSGLLVACRSVDAFELLSKGLKKGALRKTYLLVCEAEGLSSAGEIAIPIAHHPKDQKRMYACLHPRDVARYRPRDATTSFRVLAVKEPWAIVEASASAALRHQIRVHMAAIEHPLAGDALYGGPGAQGLTRHALHANHVAWEGDSLLPPFEVRSGLPPELVSVFPEFAEFADETAARW